MSNERLSFKECLEIIKEYKRRNTLKWTYLARRIGVSNSTVANIVQGIEKSPRKSTVNKIYAFAYSVRNNMDMNNTKKVPKTTPHPYDFYPKLFGKKISDNAKDIQDNQDSINFMRAGMVILFFALSSLCLYYFGVKND